MTAGGGRATARARRARAGDGQGLVEFSLVVGVLLLILLGILDFGFLFNHHLTLEYATREGARAGAAMADGSIKDGNCGAGALTAANVDPLVIAAVQRVLKSPGSLVDLSQVSQISIYEVGTNGTISGNKNIWQRRVQADGSPNPANPAVPCQAPVQLLDFYEVSSGWPAAGRDNGPAPDSIGVGISYVYRFQTPLSGILRFLGGAGWTQVQVSDRTVMALEPTE